MLLTVLTLLMVQLKSLSRTLMVVLTAPLGLIGVTAGLFAFGLPFGFVAMLGTIALSGIIMRNSIILVDQIEQDIAAGAGAVGRGRRRDDAPLQADRADRGGGGAGDDSSGPQRLLRADGGGHDGRHSGCHGADAGFPARALCGLVPGETAGDGIRAGGGPEGEHAVSALARRQRIGGPPARVKWIVPAAFDRRPP